MLIGSKIAANETQKTLIINVVATAIKFSLIDHDLPQVNVLFVVCTAFTNGTTIISTRKMVLLSILEGLKRSKINKCFLEVK